MHALSSRLVEKALLEKKEEEEEEEEEEANHQIYLKELCKTHKF